MRIKGINLLNNQHKGNMKKIILITTLILSSCKPACETAEECTAQLKKEQQEAKPVLVTEIDGVKLYRAYDSRAHSNFVWFSTTGTQVDECYPQGKTSVCISTQTPNAAKE